MGHIPLVIQAENENDDIQFLSVFYQIYPDVNKAHVNGVQL